MELIRQFQNLMEPNWMDRKSKLSKHVPVKREAVEEAVVVVDHTGHEALGEEEVDLEEAEEMEDEEEEEAHQEHAITAIRPDTWQEPALKNVGRDEVDLAVVEEEAGHVTTAMKKGTWQENVHQETDVEFGS